MPDEIERAQISARFLWGFVDRGNATPSPQQIGTARKWRKHANTRNMSPGKPRNDTQALRDNLGVFSLPAPHRIATTYAS